MSLIYRRKPMSRVHSQTHSNTSGVNLMTHEHHKGSAGLHVGGNNLTIGNPMNTHGGSGSSISAGASTILAASLEREAQRERENYTATVRNIISRAAAAREGRIFDDEIERDSISNEDLPPTRTCWAANVQENGYLTRGKKLSWDNPHGIHNNKVSIKNDLNFCNLIFKTQPL